MSQVTDMQKGLYYIQQTQPNTTAYNVAFGARITSNVCLTTLEAAFQQVQRNNSVLRQTFTETQGEISIIERPDLQLELQQHNTANVDEESLKFIVESTAKTPFNLNKELCLRVDIFPTYNQNHIMLLTAHHANFDFWSLALLLEQVAIAYQNIADSHSQTSPQNQATTLQFTDVAEQLKANQQSEKYQQAKAAIVENLTDANTQLNLSTDFARPQTNTYQGASYSFSVPAEVTGLIKETAKTQNVTTYMLLLSVYQVLLHRYTNQNDILVGSPTAGREKRKYHHVMGNFVNTLITRSKIDANTCFSDMLQRTYKQVVEAIRNQAVMFPQVVEAIKPKHDKSRTPLIQAHFAWDKLPQFAEFEHFFCQSSVKTSVNWAGLTLEPYWVPQQEGQFDLALEMGAELNGELTATLKYRSDLFCKKSMAQFSSNFVELLKTLCENPSQNINQARILSTAQKNNLLSIAHSPTLIKPRANTVHELFAQQALLTPNKVAVQDKNTQLTYQELDQRSSHMANVLQQQYAVKGQQVGVCLHRDTNMLVALLAILKAGAGYVPITPNMPAERANMIMEDADLAVMLLGDDITHIHPGSSIPTATFSQLTNNRADKNINDSTPVAASQTAYIIFTSGSTGRPKGVSVPHKCVVNCIESICHTPGIKADERLLAVAPFSFDISVTEFFLPISQGGCVIIADTETATDPDKLIKAINTFNPSLMQPTPSTWKMLYSAGWQGKKDLSIISSGEPMPQTLAEQLIASCAHLYTAYGPTETTIWCSIIEYKGGNVTIGYPMANTQMYILDQQRQLVPQGVTGEIYIAGTCVTDGYYGKPELTEKAYLPNPFGEGALYKSGDLGRINQDGLFECSGRADNQIKIRGFRIELADIEENIRRIEQIHDAVVQPQIINNETALVCHYVLNKNQNISKKGIQTQLKSRLPNYMIPSFFVEIASMPMTANGKTDKKSLPKINLENNNSQREIIAPTTPLENTLLQQWQDVLQQTQISITDDFYDIGGHSLLAVQLTSKIKQALNIDIDNQFTLNYTTIANMAQAIEQGHLVSDNSMLVKLNQGEATHSPLFLMHPIGGTVHCYMALTQSIDKSQPVYAFQNPGIDDADEAEVGIEEIAQKYVAEIRKQQPQGPYQLGGWCFGGVIAYEAANQLQAMGETISGVYVFDTRAPIIANHPDDGDDATLLSWFARDLAIPHGKTLHIPPETLREIDIDDQFAYVLERARAINIIENDADEEKLMNYFQVYIANGMALQMYPEKALEIPVTLYRALDEPEDYGEYLGWDALLNDAFTVVDIKGDHNSIMYKPLVNQIGDDLNNKLDNLTTAHTEKECTYE